MGHRTVKRVPLDFEAPLNETWKGYLNPHYPEGGVQCPSCEGSGYNEATQAIDDIWYDHEGFGVRWTYCYYLDREGKPARHPPWLVRGDCRSWMHSLTIDEVQALLDHNRLWDFTRTCIPGVGWQDRETPVVVDQALVNAVNEWSLHGMGHDSLNRHICVEARARRLGAWGKCSTCDGSGEVWPSAKLKALYDAWEQEEPPVGEGWQFWETVSEGSPQSPVFSTPEGLAAWCAKNATMFARETLPYAGWLKFILADRVDAGSMFLINTGTGQMGSLAALELQEEAVA